MTFGDLEHCVHENIIAMTNDPAVISAQVTDLLNALDKEDGLVVRRVAKDIAEGIAHERAVKDGDMVSVIGTLSAALNPMIAWLEHHDYNGGSLRQVALAPRLVCPFTIPRNDEKSPGGKFNRGQVRDIVREVAMNPSLGVETAREILDGERDGAKKVSSLKPEHLDMVYRACRSLLTRASAPEEDDKVIGRIYAPPGYGLEYVEMMKDNYRRWAAAGDPLYIEIVKQMDGDDTEEQDDPNAHHGRARR
jgi:hypothetical protein